MIERRLSEVKDQENLKSMIMWTGKNEVGSYPNEVEGDIRELVTEINEIEINEDNCFMVAAYFHARFENIHPFADGNGG